MTQRWDYKSTISFSLRHFSTFAFSLSRKALWACSLGFKFYESLSRFSFPSLKKPPGLTPFWPAPLYYLVSPCCPQLLWKSLCFESLKEISSLLLTWPQISAFLLPPCNSEAYFLTSTKTWSLSRTGKINPCMRLIKAVFAYSCNFSPRQHFSPYAQHIERFK